MIVAQISSTLRYPDPAKVSTLTKKNSMETLHSRKLHLQLCLLSSLLLLSSAYTVPDKYFINCGASDNVTTADGQRARVFVGDRNFTAGKGKAVKSSNSSIHTLYRTARVYKRTSSYEFPINENGTYIVRLHFFVFSSSPDLSVALFDVWASGFSLLTNYSVRSITTSPRIEEFLLTIPQGNFKIYFIPSQESSLAFVNAIEVFLAPDNFFVDNTTRIGNYAQDNVSYSGLLSQVLHTIYRINVGGDYINGDDLWRNWVPDDKYLYESGTTSNNSYSSKPNYVAGGATQYIAPDLVYQTAKQLNANASGNFSISNATWVFPVNKSATHIVRIHFCDIVSATLDDLWFDLNINYPYIIPLIVPYEIKQSLAAPFYFDFVVDPDNTGVMDITIRNKEDSTIPNAFLNGVEIMEFMEKSSSIPKESESKKFSPFIIGLVSSVAFVILVVVVATGLKCRKQEPDQSLVELLYAGFNSKNRLTERSSNAPLAPNLNLSLRISLVEIQNATENFNAKHLIGEGGFGKVYKGTLRNGMTVAVKRGEAGHGQGLREFQNEIMVLSQIRYRHLVSLIGYCDQDSETILVYEFMEMGTLRDHLYHTDGSSEKSSSPSELSWNQRLGICIGAASGLDYLHAQAGRIIHRDVKSTNILLDKDYVAKVADFGLSKSGRPDPINCTMSVKGSFGYLDPEYLATQQYTEKSDVYSFGVVLFEVLCARPPIDNSLPREEEQFLADWATQLHREGELEKIIDPVLVGKIKPTSLRKFSETAAKCLKQNGTERPSMRQVLYDLQYAQQLQETLMDREQHEASTTNITSLIRLQLPAVLNVPVLEDDESPIVGDEKLLLKTYSN